MTSPTPTGAAVRDLELQVDDVAEHARGELRQADPPAPRLGFEDPEVGRRVEPVPGQSRREARPLVVDVRRRHGSPGTGIFMSSAQRDDEAGELDQRGPIALDVRRLPERLHRGQDGDQHEQALAGQEQRRARDARRDPALGAVQGLERVAAIELPDRHQVEQVDHRARVRERRPVGLRGRQVEQEAAGGRPEAPDGPARPIRASSCAVAGCCFMRMNAPKPGMNIGAVAARPKRFIAATCPISWM